MSQKLRADIAMVEKGLCSTRSQASQLISQGVVYIGEEKVKKPSQNVDPNLLSIKKEKMFVSRGGDKLFGAIKKLKISGIKNIVVADVGASTGGFTDCLLQLGARKVYCIDVGHGQLNPELLNDSRVINLEGINIRNGIELEEKVDLVVADLSFISLKLVLKEMFQLLKPEGKLLTLVKPQFEVGREGIDGSGIVKNDELRNNALSELYHFYRENNWPLNGFCDSPILGKDGNKEYFFYSDLASPMWIDEEEIRQ